jgi:hypothetical protein
MLQKTYFVTKLKWVLSDSRELIDVSLKIQFALTTRNILLTYHISNVPNDRGWKR